MGIGIIFVDRDCFFETCDCFTMPVEHLQCTTAVNPGADVSWRACERGVKRCERLVGAFEIEQCSAAVVQGFDMTRRPRKERIEFRKRFRLAAKSGERDAPIEKRIGMDWIARENRVETG